MDIFSELVELLKENKYHISAAESCTGGMFISSVIEYPGTSAIVDRSFITYSAAAKTELVGVPADIIADCGLVSEKVAFYMAKGAAQISNSEIGIGITGNAGPSSCDEDKTVGTVCFGICINGATFTFTQNFGKCDRTEVRRKACRFAAEKTVELIKQKGNII